MRAKGVLLTAILVLAVVSMSCNLLRMSAEETLPAPSPELKGATVEASPAPPEVTEAPAATAETPTEGSTPTELPSSPTPAPTRPEVRLGPCEQDVCIVPFQFPLMRPIAPPGRLSVDPSYRFESSDHGKRDPHHGVEFLNSQGTPVLAAAAGEVVGHAPQGWESVGGWLPLGAPKGWPCGVEMRNQNWLKPEYFECLSRYQVTQVFSSWEAMPPVDEQMALPGSRTNPDLVAALTPFHDSWDRNCWERDSTRSRHVRAQSRTAGTSFVSAFLKIGVASSGLTRAITYAASS